MPQIFPLSVVLPGLLRDWQIWFAPVLFLGGGLIVGWLLEKTLIAAARKITHGANLEFNTEIASILRGVIQGLCVLAGLYLATYALPWIPENALALTRKLVFIAAMLMAIRLLAQVAVASMRFYFNHSQELQALPNTSIFENLVRGLVFLVGGLMLLQTLGVSVVPILTALGVGGLAISLALQDTLANMFAGINMILARQIKVDDFVKLEGGYEGFVQDIGWRNTVIRQLNNNLVIVPNSKMAASIIINTTLPLPEMALLVEVGVSYNSNLDTVERVTIETAKEVLSNMEGAVKNFEPFIRYHTFGDSSINFTVILRVENQTDQYPVKHEFIKRLYARYRAEGIGIPFPQRVIHVDSTLLSALQSQQSDTKPGKQASSGKAAPNGPAEAD